MKTRNILASVLLISMASANIYAAGGILSTPKSVVNLTNDTVKIDITFKNAQAGDLYVFTEAGGQRVWLEQNGNFSFAPVAHTANGNFSGTFEVYSLNTYSGLAPSSYPVYSIVTTVGGDPLNVNDWVSGISTLNKVGIRVGQDVSVTKDFNNDGFSDDDKNHDGFSDTDRNQDGYADDDANQDGYSDDDQNQDGYHDDDNNRDGYHDDDNDQDGYHDGDKDHNGVDDADEGNEGNDNDGNDNENDNDNDNDRN